MPDKAKRILGLAGAAAIAVMLGTAAQAQPQRAIHVSVGDTSRPPIGWVD
jgi:hypothetical protein